MKHALNLALLCLLAAHAFAAEPVDHLLGNPKASASEDPLRKPEAPARAERSERTPRGPNEERRRDFMRDRVEQLKESGVTREEMQKLRAALEAVGQNEIVRAARVEAEKARKTVREALQAYARAQGLPELERPTAGDPSTRPTPEKMQAMRRAMAEARNDPAVQAAYEAAKITGKKLRDTVRATLIASDATLTPILEKMGDARDSLLDASGENRGPRGQRRGEKGAGKPEAPTPPVTEPGMGG